MSDSIPPLTETDYYIERGCVVFTRAYLLRRGKCCGSGCRHCPYRNLTDAQALDQTKHTDVPEGKDSSR